MVYFLKIASNKKVSNFVVYIMKFISLDPEGIIYNIYSIRYKKYNIISPWFNKFNQINLSVH